METSDERRWLVTARNLPKTAAVAIGLLIAIIGCLIIPIDFALEGKGELQPITRRNVFCGEAGVVTEVLVKHRDAVKKGDPLLILRNTDLMVQLEDVVGQELQSIMPRAMELSLAAESKALMQHVEAAIDRLLGLNAHHSQSRFQARDHRDPPGRRGEVAQGQELYF